MVFSDWRQLPAMTDALQAAGWEWRGIVIWHKPSARPMLGEFRRDVEFVLHGVKRPLRQTSRTCLPGVFRHAVNLAHKVHLTSKPVPLVVDLLAVTPPDAVVLDPFMGGGTTALACAATGRRFVGVELSQAYFEVAQAQIEAAERN